MVVAEYASGDPSVFVRGATERVVPLLAAGTGGALAAWRPPHRLRRARQRPGD